MDAKIKQALSHDRTIDITTIGRKTGQPRRIEIWFHNVNGQLFITGLPGQRSWYANVVAHPQLIFHLKESVQADLPAHATPITEESQRRPILAAITKTLNREQELETWIANSPLIEVTLDNGT